jgi:outer membrane protein with beta-barrel domain
MTLVSLRPLLKKFFFNPKKNDMRTKLLLIVLFAFTLSKSAFSQQSRAIVKAGVNLANVSTTNDGNIDDANMLTSFQVGIVGDIHVTSLLYFQPGLVFTGKGSKIQIGRPEENLYAKQTSNPYYIEVPANLVVKLPFNSESHFFIGAGPYGAIGVAGKAKTDMTVLGFSSSTDNKIEFSNDDPSTFGQEEGTGLGVLKRFDYGVNGIIGIEGKKLVLSAGYGLGLAKLQSGSDSGEDNNNKHRVLSFTIGVKL